MTVAVRNTPETSSSPRLFDHLAVGVLAGVAYVLAAAWLVVFGLPRLWWSVVGASALTVAVLGLLVLAAGTALAVFGVRLLSTHARPGLRAGIFFGLLGVIVAAEIAAAVGGALEHNGVNSTVGIAATAAVFVLLAGAMFVSFGLPACERWLATADEQGWFTAASYKPRQGFWVRRGTMVGVLTLGVCGVITLYTHHTIETGPSTWSILVPYSGGLVIPVVPHVTITVPLLLLAATLWVAYRVVNFPTFADFLIATEAEMNKVSWTTRKRLVQDTVVVLVTVALLTFFLFVVDQLWAVVLTRVGVLQVPQNPTTAAAQKEPSY